MAVGFDPIPRKELYLDVITGGDSELPEPITREEKYLGKIAGMSVDIPEPITRYEQYLYAIANGDTLTLNPIPRLEMYLAKACGQDIDVPEPITREEKYWFDYINGGRWEVIEYTGAVPVEIYANGEPLIELLVSGNMNQSGTPTPTTPIQPQETGERTGNLFDVSTVEKGRIDNGKVGYASQTSSLTIEGGTVSFTTTATYRGVCSGFFEIPEGTATITFNFIRNEALGVKFVFYDHTKTWLNQDYVPVLSDIPPVTANVPSGAKYLRLSFTGQITGGYSYTMSNLMLNSGSTALPYEPYGIKIPISSANTTTPVYLGEVESTRQIKQLVLTGKENWKYSTSSQAHWIENVPNDYDNTLKSRITTVCTHYNCIQNNTGFSGMVNGDLRLYAKEASPIAHELYIKDETYTSAADFKAYLAAQYAAGTPVCVWYVLATPTTAVVNEPLRKIGTYADSLSVSQTIPTVEGENLIDVETTLKPSEIYIKYKGRSNS